MNPFFIVALTFVIAAAIIAFCKRLMRASQIAEVQNNIENDQNAGDILYIICVIHIGKLSGWFESKRQFDQRINLPPSASKRSNYRNAAVNHFEEHLYQL